VSRKDKRYLCYPYMRESASTVDFEIRTDSLTTRIGLAASLTKDIPKVHLDLMELLPMAYHLNGSVRGKLAISAEDLERLSRMYDEYVAEVQDQIETFLLPQGTTAACELHVCRSEAKKSVRALHKVSLERDVPDILFDYAHLLANVLFVMAVYVNQQYGVEEIPFVSQSYPVKRRERSGGETS
jgi:cob(I)alamin adenosyltransferase